MAKLYAEITSDKGGRVVGKGGNEQIICDIRHNNRIIVSVEYNHKNDLLQINTFEKPNDNQITVNINGFIT